MRVVVTVLALASFGAIGALAAPCKTSGSTKAKELTFDLKSEQTLRGLHYAFRFGLMPAEFPSADVAAKVDPCTRSSIELPGRASLSLFGENDDSPPRWSKAQGPDSPIIYLASMPRPDPAATWADGGKKSDNGSVDFGPGDMMFALVLQPKQSKLRMVFAFFDDMPDDERLKSMIGQIGDGKARWQVGFDVETRQVTPNPK